jgi:transposase
VIKLGDVVMILDLHRQGLSVSAIARELGIDRKTVRKYVARGLEPPVYGPRQARSRLIDPYVGYLRERVTAYPGLSARRLLREIRGRGYRGGYTAVTETVHDLRPPPQVGYEVRFETPPGEQAQVDFAHFETVFSDEPGGRPQGLAVLPDPRLQPADLGAVRPAPGPADGAALPSGGIHRARRGAADDPLRPDEPSSPASRSRGHIVIVYSRHLIDFAAHHGYQPRACRPYRAKTKGKVERPYRYVRQDFFLARTFCNLDDLNAQLARGSTRSPNGGSMRRLGEPSSMPPPKSGRTSRRSARPYRTVLRLERRITRDGMISVGGNLYSVPDATRRRVVEVQCLAEEILILEDSTVVAAHPVLDGRNRRRVAPGHRRPVRVGAHRPVGDDPAVVLERAGDRVARRPLAVYESIAPGLASQGGRR